MKGSCRAVTKGPTEKMSEEGLNDIEATAIIREPSTKGAETQRVENNEVAESASDDEFVDEGPLIQIENGDDLLESCRQQ